MTTLGSLLAEAGIDATLSDADATRPVSTVELDSRQCQAGSVFVCMPGTTSTGEAHVDDALARGAVCVVSATPITRAPLVVSVAPSELRAALASLSSTIVGHPADALTLVGVTGTNGKTTVTWLVRGILSRLGYTAASIGTLNGQRTTPAAPDLHRALRDVVDRATTERQRGAVALEVSSHALDQGRVDGVRFDASVFTNLSHEHLDYHGTMEHYFEAKTLLFAPEHAVAAVVCVDDEWGQRLAERVEVPTVRVASSEATSVVAELGRTSLSWRGRDVSFALTGRVNVANALLALSAVEVLGVDETDAVDALRDVEPVPGRLEPVGTGAPSVLVDYAHTPAALELVLADLRRLRPGARLVVVLGAGGDRDHAKRPVMGEIAARLADEVVVTSDNPRSEDPEAIIDAIMAGASGPGEVRREPDRAVAITSTIERAGDGDVVLLAGKGHETTQEANGVVRAFDDRLVAAAALRARGSSC